MIDVNFVTLLKRCLTYLTALLFGQKVAGIRSRVIEGVHGVRACVKVLALSKR